MRPIDPSARAALAAAQERICKTVDAAVVEVASALLMLVKSAATYRERGQLAFAQIHILESRELLLSSFTSALRDRVDEDLASQSESRGNAATTDWQAIGLVDEGQIEERISFERIGQLIAHRSEAELRELDALLAGMLGHSWADPSRNPLRGSILGSALHKAMEKITDEPHTLKIYGRELGHAVANAMPACFAEIAEDLRRRGVRKAELMRPADEPPSRPPSHAAPSFEEARKAWEASWIGRRPDEPPLRSWEASIHGRFAEVDPLPPGTHIEDSAALLEWLMRGGVPGTMPPLGGSRTPPSGATDGELMKLLRHLNGGGSATGDFDALPRDTGRAPPAGPPGSGDFASTRPGVPLGISWEQPPSDGLSGLMAVNLIRAHHAQLVQAARGKLDHLVIEVVSSLFDQILSDARVPPEMARQIARLQLPVLRAALADGTFFSSRRHPVRRFINRVASLACAFDSYAEGAAKELLGRTRELVDEIVEGDFDQLTLYDAKLLELERFVADQTHAEIRASAAAETLRGKELEWRIQQRFSVRLRAALETLALPAFLLDFLTGAWAQAIVTASRRDGVQAAYPRQLRKTGVELVKSVQPKRSSEERKRFVAGLPGLMAELTQAMKFLGWPQAAQDEFFGQLVTQHAGSLKGTPRSDLDHNMMLRNVEAAFRIAVPSAEEAAAETDADAAVDPAATPIVEHHFSPAEELAIGLVSEHEVDWSRDVTPPAASGLVAPSPPAPSPRQPAVAGAGASALPVIEADATLTAPSPQSGESTDALEAPELAAGPQLRDHLQLGFSYQLNLKNEWQKVRLTYMSPARSLFLFAHGAKGRETISMTARTLGRLCAAGRMRAFENAFLIERATQRARQQLAGLGRGATRH